MLKKWLLIFCLSAPILAEAQLPTPVVPRDNDPFVFCTYGPRFPAVDRWTVVGAGLETTQIILVPLPWGASLVNWDSYYMWLFVCKGLNSGSWGTWDGTNGNPTTNPWVH